MTTVFRPFSLSLALVTVAALTFTVASFGAYVVSNGTCTDGTTNSDICGNNMCSVVSGIVLNGEQYCYAYGCTNDTVSQNVKFCLNSGSNNNSCAETFSNDTTKCTLSACSYWNCVMNKGTCTTSLSSGGSCRYPNTGGGVPTNMYRPAKCTQS